MTAEAQREFREFLNRRVECMSLDDANAVFVLKDKLSALWRAADRHVAITALALTILET